VKKIINAFIILIAFIFSGCGLFDRPEVIPAFVKVEQFNLTTLSSHGTSSSRITDCWVYLNDNLVGVYELPALVPIHAQGNQNIKIKAGIMKNGVAGERAAYPFYTFYNETMNLVSDSIFSINPDITYEVNYTPWIEDFEDPGIKFDDYQSDTVMFVGTSANTQGLLEGNCGVIKMNSNHLVCEMRTDEPYFDGMPKNIDIPAYMELNFKSNYSFQVGILSKDDQIASFVRTPLITFNPTTDSNGVMQWKKTYLYLTDATTFYPVANDFEIYIRVLNPEGYDGIEVYVDNIKIFYRQ
jgi:hypothetical protein